MAIGMRRFSVLAVALCTAGATLLAQDSGTDRITLELLLGRAGWYVLDFLEKFSNVVSEETYLQDSTVPMQSSAVIGRAGATARNRRLKSDFLLVSVSTAQDWVPFRDVFEVDAQPVRDREQRLTRLFLKPSLDSLQQANRIQDESARYNLGNMKRTVNNPVLGVVVLQADMQHRFKLLARQDRLEGRAQRLGHRLPGKRAAVHRQRSLGSGSVRARAHLGRRRDRPDTQD